MSETRPGPRLEGPRGDASAGGPDAESKRTRAVARASMREGEKNSKIAPWAPSLPPARARARLALVTSARGPVLAIDYGSRRIGLAVSDAGGTFAFPAGHIDRRGGPDDLEAVRALVAERGVLEIVVGLPIHMDGREGPEARAARAFAAELGRATGLEVR